MRGGGLGRATKRHSGVGVLAGPLRGTVGGGSCEGL